MQRRSRTGSASVKSRRRKAATLKSRTAPKVRHRSSEAGQETEVVRLFRELSEAREQQVATADVLKVISRSPSDVQPVFDMIAASATRLCKARHCSVFRFDGKLIHFAAEHGLSPEYIEAIRRTYPIPPGRTSAASRAVLTGNVAEIPDVQADSDYAHGNHAKAQGFRSLLAVPMLEANGKHLLGLINDVLDLSKIEAGQLVLELSDYCVQDIAQTVRSTLEPLAADKKLAFKLDLSPELPPGHGDGRRLTQVLINLVGNAISCNSSGYNCCSA